MSEIQTELPPLEERPLVTFALFAYNQEKYIREAIEGAFAQTYEPLEIILSDDCSTDRTFEIMEEMAAKYRGDHRIVLNRQPLNQGIGEHVNSVAKISHGSLLIFSAGDDISYPYRTSKIVETWLTDPENNLAFESLYDNISQSGEKIESPKSLRKRKDDLLKEFSLRNEFIVGATSAYHKKVFTSFPPLGQGIVHEDRILPYRGILLNGKIKQIAANLVAYRRDVGISSSYRINSKKSAIVFSKRVLADYTQKIVDSQHINRADATLLLLRGLNRYTAEYFAADAKLSLRNFILLTRNAGLKYGTRSFLKIIKIKLFKL